jgi:hypothetical protein
MDFYSLRKRNLRLLKPVASSSGRADAGEAGIWHESDFRLWHDSAHRLGAADCRQWGRYRNPRKIGACKKSKEALQSRAKYCVDVIVISNKTEVL